MTSCLSELKVTPSFCFAFKIPDNATATINYTQSSNIQYLSAMYGSAKSQLIFFLSLGEQEIKIAIWARVLTQLCIVLLKIGQHLWVVTGVRGVKCSKWDFGAKGRYWSQISYKFLFWVIEKKNLCQCLRNCLKLQTSHIGLKRYVCRLQNYQVFRAASFFPVGRQTNSKESEKSEPIQRDSSHHCRCWSPLHCSAVLRTACCGISQEIRLLSRCLVRSNDLSFSVCVFLSLFNNSPL